MVATTIFHYTWLNHIITHIFASVTVTSVPCSSVAVTSVITSAISIFIAVIICVRAITTAS